MYPVGVSGPGWQPEGQSIEDVIELVTELVGELVIVLVEELVMELVGELVMEPVLELVLDQVPEVELTDHAELEVELVEPVLGVELADPDAVELPQSVHGS